MHLVTVELAVRGRAEVIFNVTRTADIIRRDRAAVEFVKDVMIRFAHHRGEHIKTPSMRHADDDFFNAERAAAFDDLLQRRNHGFCAVEAETLGAGIFDVEKVFETFRLNELVEDGFACLRA